MKRKAYYIHRLIGFFSDTLKCLWEGNDLPAFSKREPYYFDDLGVATRVRNRLAARYHTADGVPGICGPMNIHYEVVTVEWDDESCPCCGKPQICTAQILSQFLPHEE